MASIDRWSFYTDGVFKTGFTACTVHTSSETYLQRPLKSHIQVVFVGRYIGSACRQVVLVDRWSL